MTMKYRWMGIMLASALGASLAHAGTKFDFPITITKNPDGSGIFRGSLASTRNMPNVNAQMSCSTGSSPDFRFAVCFGTDGTQSLICSTTNLALVETAASLAGDSH